ncbi:MarR family winged helix-turn-helix transcriptional regulator [Nitratireductor kimnyeongensis]|uniref:MarR family winged helix-turn-helix transcriptional regulator n=1 Tax=Nitratireductor kimnyeongensis TaxID=430679 RepID=A0ABW0T892_9HYPH|nr:MarR family transcriptional regulator [Nitratireductor kimnyeongensis]QZZ36349.1 MarR family transcriptional regulator [Nitratireductor kimnyeongensis]
MAKAAKGATIGLLQSAARLSRTALAERLLEYGLYAGQDKLMLALSVENGQTPSQLANLLGVRPPTITKTINRLANQGFLEKRLSKEDGRRAYVFLTQDGEQAIRAIEKSVRKTEKIALKGFEKKDRQILTDLLLKIEANLNGTSFEGADDDETVDVDA